jgi:protein-tyrosine phosphatase
MNRILFVCTGNICRSPVAEGIARARAGAMGLALEFDSAGTHDYHIGEPPDRRSRATAQAAGTPIDDLRARQFVSTDYYDFDLILAADRGHLRSLQARRPGKARAQVDLLLPWCGIEQPDEVPDPYYGSLAGFDEVQRLLEGAIDGLLLRVQREGR